MTVAELEALDHAALERLYRDTPVGPLPVGRFRGRHLGYLDNAGARQLHVRAMDGLLFQAVRFGIDFDSRRWWFVRPRLQAGHFALAPERSRWRDTDCLTLRYDVSRLPGPIRHALYDEVKPLGPDLALGLGGMNADAGHGDHFWFSLRRV